MQPVRPHLSQPKALYGMSVLSNTRIPSELDGFPIFYVNIGFDASQSKCSKADMVNYFYGFSGFSRIAFTCFMLANAIA